MVSMKRPVILCPVRAGHPGHHGVHAQRTAVDSQGTNQDLGPASLDHVPERKLSNSFVPQKPVRLGMNGASGLTVTLSATRVTAYGLELAPSLESATARLTKPKLVLMDPAPSGANGVISESAALSAEMGPNLEKDNASESEPVMATQVNVKCVATGIALDGQTGQNGQFVVSPVARENIIELESVVVSANAKVMLSIVAFVTWVTVQPGPSGRIGASVLLSATEEIEVEAESVMAVTIAPVQIAMLWNATFALVLTGQFGVSGRLAISPVVRV